MKVLKFGGQSLTRGTGITNVLRIIADAKKEDAIAVVVSAIGNTTDLLEQLYSEASNGKQNPDSWGDLVEIYEPYAHIASVKELLQGLEVALYRIANRDRTSSSKDEVLAYGELLSTQCVANHLSALGVQALPIDSRKFLKTVDGHIDLEQSRSLSNLYFEHFNFAQVPVITGFIASDQKGTTTTLGRNGSNYSAALIANFLNAKELQNWTNVNGVFTARPEWVPDARRIENMTYQEAHELANFGANILHAKTIEPLIEKDIPLIIKNTLEPDEAGTRVSKKGGAKGIKAVSVVKDIALLTLRGNGLLGQVGIDARIFNALYNANISVRLISQASSERGIGFVIDAHNGEQAARLLKHEFRKELANKTLEAVDVYFDKVIIAIVGRHNYSLEKAIHGLRRNKIWMHLISNSISGSHISLVVDETHLQKALNVVHGEVFGGTKTLNVFCLGKGVVGAELINQLVHTPTEVEQNRSLKINVVGVADSQRFIFNRSGVGANWHKNLKQGVSHSALADLIEEVKTSFLENVVFVDNTSSQSVTDQYPDIFDAGFDLVAANKKLNSGPNAVYKQVRKKLERNGRFFLYETNVGAGLPIIDTLKKLHASADRITKIRGVFSGSLSYLFNTFSVGDLPFFDVLEEARSKGLTEPDPREDLSGLDVARKLIILAREIGLDIDLEQVEVENLIPKTLRNYANYKQFGQKKDLLNKHYDSLRAELTDGHVFRYVGEVNCDSGKLTVRLETASKESSLGGIKGADSIFEIFTESYGTQPMVIQGAGAGAQVTARGVYSDLIRLGAMA